MLLYAAYIDTTIFFTYTFAEVPVRKPAKHIKKCVVKKKYVKELCSPEAIF